MERKAAILFLLLISTLAFGRKQVCFSIDDLPVVNYGITDTCYQKELFDDLISSLKKNQVPAIGFVIGQNLYNYNKSINPFQAGLLKEWVKNGLDVGNHTDTHMDYDLTSYKQFSNDILNAEALIGKVAKEKGNSMHYFRFPYLHEGSTKEKADSLSRFLVSHHYQVAPVTISCQDYLFAITYKNAKEKKEHKLMERIGHDYMEYMEKTLVYYETLSYKLFNRDINQILLIHASLINSDYTDALVAMYKRHGYSFISIKEALKDKVYKNKITTYDSLGISWISRYGLSQGKKGVFFTGGPIIPEYLINLANHQM